MVKDHELDNDFNVNQMVVLTANGKFVDRGRVTFFNGASVQIRGDSHGEIRRFDHSIVEGGWIHIMPDPLQPGRYYRNPQEPVYLIEALT